ncbi:hypothetical protein HanPI659440_Chr01g0033441 [Helianthus annuus]|nr:hypothetical protein HanPI659440_Chr01g0033441 [Helianthus annuus]
MINEPWVAAAITTDALVADLLLHIKRSSSLPTPAPPLSVNPPGWGDHKSRSKPSAICNSTVGKGQQRRSPSTPFSWSDGYDESSRCSDHRSGKVCTFSVVLRLHVRRKLYFTVDFRRIVW